MFKNSRNIFVLSSFLFLSACASITDFPAGSSMAQVTAKFGNPTHVCDYENGTKRVVWSQQPLGQHAFGANVDKNDNVDEIVPIFTNQNFSKLSQGKWDAEKVACEFGPPAEKESVGLPSNRSLVWSYRYKESGAWNSLMHVYFDSETGLVTKHHAGPDPLFEPSWLLRL